MLETLELRAPKQLRNIRLTPTILERGAYAQRKTMQVNFLESKSSEYIETQNHVFFRFRNVECMNIWNAISNFAHNLGVSQMMINNAKQDLDNLHKQYAEIIKSVREKHKSKWNESLAIQNFFPWPENLYCFFTLILADFRHAALRELRSYLEASERSYYIDSRYDEKNYEDKVNLLRIFKPKKALREKDNKKLREILGEKQEEEDKIRKKIKLERKRARDHLLQGIPEEKQDELEEFYSVLCDYVHFSEPAQIDALRDPGLSRALRQPKYVKDVEMLKKTFCYCRYLLVESLEKRAQKIHFF